MINNIGTPSFELQIDFGVLQIDIENSTIGLTSSQKSHRLRLGYQDNQVVEEMTAGRF